MIGKNGNWECPKDYHSVEGVETAQCYPNSEPCLCGSALVQPFLISAQGQENKL